MDKIIDNNHLQSLIKDNDFIVLYFSNSRCAVCNSLKIKIDDYFNEEKKYIKIIEIPVEEFQEMAARFMIFSTPVVILYIFGKESIRMAGNFSLSELDEKIKRLKDLI
ncbi:MAG: thioredoxin family protein [Prolixibacteraceae bacterium]|nr:thioredoxin family protein [Prolixibacteraceae bacterium]